MVRLMMLTFYRSNPFHPMAYCQGKYIIYYAKTQDFRLLGVICDGSQENLARDRSEAVGGATSRIKPKNPEYYS
jgi:hypothetical protein